MPDEPERQPDTAADETDIDLFCLDCGYNLRGLPGDPRRCPECGYVNCLGDQAVSTDLVVAQLKQMQRWPNVCVVSVWLMSVYAILVVLGKLALADFHPAGTAPCCAVPALAAPFAWIWGVAEFYRTSRGHQGWLKALAHYHAYGMFAFALSLMLILLMWWAHTSLEDTFPGIGRYAGFLTGLLFGVTVVLPILLMRWAYHRVSGTAWFREAATELAREQLRKRLRKRLKSRPFFDG